MLKIDKHTTPVIFRVLQGQVIALFPALAGTNDINTCDSYMHNGQHSAAGVDLGRRCRLATHTEYMPLKKELRGLGYRLRVITAMCSHHRNERLKQINREV